MLGHSRWKILGVLGSGVQASRQIRTVNIQSSIFNSPIKRDLRCAATDSLGLGYWVIAIGQAACSAIVNYRKITLNLWTAEPWTFFMGFVAITINFHYDSSISDALKPETLPTTCFFITQYRVFECPISGQFQPFIITSNFWLWIWDVGNSGIFRESLTANSDF